MIKKIKKYIQTRYYRKLQGRRKRLLRQPVGDFVKDYKNYGYCLLEVYDILVNRELKRLIGEK